MKAAARTGLVPALVLCAALTAPPETAWAGEELLAPFPGASSDGGGRTTQAAPTPLGATAASPVAPAGPTAAGDETADAAEGRAGSETATAPAAIGMATDNGAPQNLARESKAERPAGGSRLLRVLAGTPKAPASPEDRAAGGVALSGTSVSGTSVSGTSVFGTSVFAVEGCPRALLQRLLAGAAGEADALSALGIEHEILTLCRERQEVLVGLFEAEAALHELSAPPSGPPPAAAEKAAVAPPAPAPARRIAPATQSGAPSPLRAALVATGENAKATEPAAPRYAWFTIVGTAGALRAGITDGAQVWFVREGDPLPGGARIDAIAARPPGVRTTGGDGNGEAVLLPYSGTNVRARPGGAP
ncbi:MAG: hypothetical protein OXC15_15765 [Rhodospirillaceae bacterium]|nr:hypothetical protein [Rhodospirillaceae bacterium]